VRYRSTLLSGTDICEVVIVTECLTSFSIQKSKTRLPQFNQFLKRDEYRLASLQEQHNIEHVQ
jgi:hypothetical protein